MRYARVRLIALSVGLLGLLIPGGAVAQAPKADETPAQATKAASATSSAPKSGYVGSEVCMGCHAEQAEQFAATPMGKVFLKAPRNAVERLGCEGCHGPGEAHVEGGGGRGVGNLIAFNRKSPTPVSERNAVCLQCHEKTARLFWKGSSHESRDVACTDCHSVMEQHSERSQLRSSSVVETCANCHPQRRSQQLRFSHMPLREGKIECTSCHNPHGSAGEKLLVASSVNEVCYNCHTEKRGPFLWEHPPVVESCANCHDPHGSSKEKMLKVAKPRLCQQCHIESRHPTNPQAPGTLFTMNRQCVNCHAMIHGSNHPSGNRFLR